jgi:hypothetical protein
MKARELIEQLKQYPESNVEILVAGTFVSVEKIEVHRWSDTPQAPRPLEFFVIPIEEGQRTTGSLIGAQEFSAESKVSTAADGNVISINREIILTPKDTAHD